MVVRFGVDVMRARGDCGCEVMVWFLLEIGMDVRKKLSCVDLTLGCDEGWLMWWDK